VGFTAWAPFAKCGRIYDAGGSAYLLAATKTASECAVAAIESARSPLPCP
jgi:hypothetical protein